MVNNSIVNFEIFFEELKIGHVIYDYSEGKFLKCQLSFDDKFKGLLPSIPNIRVIEDWLKSRCIPRQRRNVKIFLGDSDIKGYNFIEEVKKTHGNLRDGIWLKFKGESLSYNEIK